MVVLREFLFRRDDLVSQFLEQIEGGAYDDEQITDRSQSSTGLAGSAGISSTKLSGERKKQGEHESAITLRQTAASRFNRLYDLLHEREDVQPLEALDLSIWNQLRRNEIVEVESRLIFAPGVKEMNSAAALGNAIPLFAWMKALPPAMLPASFDRVQAEAIGDQLPVIQEFAEHFANSAIPCTFAPLGSPTFHFFAELPRNHLLIDATGLEGELTVLAKIQRFIAKGKPETAGGLPFLPKVTINRQQRRRGKSDEPFTIRLSYPAAVATVLAIYR